MDSVLTENNGFDPRRHENSFFYPGRQSLTCIDLVDLVLTENDGFDPRRHENSFFILVDIV